MQLFALFLFLMAVIKFVKKKKSIQFFMIIKLNNYCFNKNYVKTNYVIHFL